MNDGLAIAVCGAGIGGLASALLLARRGHRVTLFERRETPGPVGPGLILQPTGMAVLDALGLADAIVACGAGIDRVLGRSQPSGAVMLDMRYAALDAGYRGVAVQRAAVFDPLHEAIRHEGVTVRSGMTVREAARGMVICDGYAPVGPFDLIVDALGAGSPLAGGAPGRPLDHGVLWATLDWPTGGPFSSDTFEQRYRRALHMAGVMPVGTHAGGGAKAMFFWSLRPDARAAWRAAPLDAWKDEVRALWPETAMLLDGIDDPDALTFARHHHRILARPYGKGIVHLGDGWRTTSPQLGQGANMALLDAFALARAVEMEGRTEIGPTYAQLRQGHARLFQALSRLLTPVYQSNGTVLPALRDRIAGRFAHARPVPSLMAALVAGTMGRPLDRLGLSPYRAADPVRTP